MLSGTSLLTIVKVSILLSSVSLALLVFFIPSSTISTFDEAICSKDLLQTCKVKVEDLVKRELKKKETDLRSLESVNSKSHKLEYKHENTDKDNVVNKMDIVPIQRRLRSWLVNSDAELSGWL